MHPTTGTNLVDIADRIPDTIMIEIDPMLQISPMVVICMMNFFKIITPEKNGQLVRIDPVILVSFVGNQFVATGLRNHELLDLLAEVPIHPAGHGAFFHRKNLFALD